MRCLALVATALVLLPAAQAQDEPACGDAMSRPCEWAVAVDESGLVEGTRYNATAGEWLKLTVDNLDGAAHTLTLEGLGVQVQAAAYSSREQVFQAAREGDFTLRDSPSGTTGTLHVLPASADVVDRETRSSTSTSATAATGRSGSASQGSPAPGLALLAGALAAAFLLSRRS